MGSGPRPVEAPDADRGAHRHSSPGSVDRSNGTAGRLAWLRNDDGRPDRARLLGYARLIAGWAVAGPAVAVGVLLGIAVLAPPVGTVLAPAVALVGWIGLLLLTGPNGRAKFYGETAYHRRARLALFAAGLAVGASALTIAIA